jgi:hypothetical protein
MCSLSLSLSLSLSQPKSSTNMVLTQQPPKEHPTTGHYSSSSSSTHTHSESSFSSRKSRTFSRRPITFSRRPYDLEPSSSAHDWVRANPYSKLHYYLKISQVARSFSIYGFFLHFVLQQKNPSVRRLGLRKTSYLSISRVQGKLSYYTKQSKQEEMATRMENNIERDRR